QRGETLLTSTPIADLTKTPSSAPIYFPQFVDGGGYVTTILLLNTSATLETGRLDLFDDSGHPLVALDASCGDSDSSFRSSVPSGGALVFEPDGVPAAARVGSAQLQPDVATSTPVGAGVFRYSPGGIAVTESGVPAVTATTHARIYIDTSQGHDTGVALAA